ncbi:MAG: hypothetical protein IPH84_11245 [Bacteroidales bacterium]|nr:hypothetical protein [Bacteroidales bacterium]
MCNSSTLNYCQKPTNIAFNTTTNSIELFPMPFPLPGQGTILSTDSLNPTRVCRIQIINSVPWATGTPDLGFIFSPSGFRTEVSKFIWQVSIPLITDSNNCFSKAANQVLNYPLPEPPSIFNVIGSGSFCQDVFPVEVGLDGSESGVTYLLYFNDSFLGSMNGNNGPINWSCSLPGTYSVVGVNAAGRYAMNGIAIVSVFPEPFVSIAPPQVDICPGIPVTLSAEVQNAGTSAEYLWKIFSVSGIHLTSTSEPFYTYLPENGDSVLVEYMQHQPCERVIESSPVLITINSGSEGGWINSDTNIFLGDSTGIMTLTGYSGSIIKWQRCFESGNWEDLSISSITFSDLPGNAGIWKYRAVVKQGECPEAYSEEVIINVLYRTLVLKFYPEGIYNPQHDYLNKARDYNDVRFQSDTADLVTIRIKSANPPYEEVFRFRDIALPISGIIKVDLPDFLRASCYIVINHRNSIETWSAYPVSFAKNLINYDFSSAAEMAFGANQGRSGQSWVILSGDINQDGKINEEDLNRIEISSGEFRNGYVPEDVNGDGTIDAADLIIIDNNYSAGIEAEFPVYHEPPVVTTNPVDSVSMTSARTKVNIISQGSSAIIRSGVCWSKSALPNLEDFFAVHEGNDLIYSIDLQGLETGCHYYFRAYATNAEGTSYGPEYSFTTLQPGGAIFSLMPLITYGTQTYNTVKIGTQVWFRENLNIGTRIDQAQNSTDNGIIEKYCSEDFEFNCDLSGGFYRWDELMQYNANQGSQGICPSGWHIPTSEDWDTLTKFLGGNNIAGGKMKSTGLKRWAFPNSGATNESGFSAVPEDFQGIYSYWLNSSECSYQQGSGYASGRKVWTNTPSVSVDPYCHKSFLQGYGVVRCIMDDSLQLVDVSTSNIQFYSLDSVITGGAVTSLGGTPVTERGVCWSSQANPDISDSHNIEGSGYGTFSSLISGLHQDSIYYFRAYATNLAGTAYGPERSISTASYGIPCPGLDSIVYEGQTYHTVAIGNQCWLKENLNVGTMTDAPAFSQNDSIIEKFCYDNLESNCSLYGGLYFWQEMMQYSYIEGSQGICPDGWHIPSASDWNALTDHLGGVSVAGGKLKDVGTAIWAEPNIGATNEYGFYALPAGQVESVALFDYFQWIGERTTFWSSTYQWEWSPSARYIVNSSGNIYDVEIYEYTGLSVRCIKNDSLELAQVTTVPATYLGSYTATSGGSGLASGGSEISSKGVCYDTIPGPTLASPHTNEGAGTGDYVSQLINLSPNTTYYARAYAENIGGIAYGNEIVFTTFDTIINTTSCPGEPTLIYGGKTYNTILIGEQCWLKENLDVGIMISSLENQYNNNLVEKYCYGNQESNCAVFGGLYQWDEAMQYSNLPGNQGICPEGWHIPDNEDWCELSYFVDSTFNCNSNYCDGIVAGTNLKASNSWNSGGNGSNSSGFTALASGYYSSLEISFLENGNAAHFWSSQDFSPGTAWMWGLYTNQPNICRTDILKTEGYSVRCIKNPNTY